MSCMELFICWVGFICGVRSNGHLRRALYKRLRGLVLLRVHRIHPSTVEGSESLFGPGALASVWDGDAIIHEGYVTCTINI